MVKLIKGDCLEKMKEIPDGSVDLILCDLPYGVTDCKWDECIPFPDLWAEYHRLLKPFGIAVLFGTEPFMSKIISSNPGEYSHQWYWKKNNVTGALLAHKQPMRCVEEIAVFICNAPYKQNSGRYQGLRDYMMSEKKKSGLSRKQLDKILGNQMSSHYFTNGQQFNLPTEKNYQALQSTGFWQRSFAELYTEWKGDPTVELKPIYNPQGVYELEKPRAKNEKGNSGVYRYVTPKKYVIKKSGYPRQLLEIANETKRFHPTQKPVELLKYLVLTYTNVGGVVLDNCMGSGSTGVACVQEDRDFIGIELDTDYFRIAKERIDEAIRSKRDQGTV